MKLHKLLLILLLFISSNSYSQTNLDSLYSVWQDETQADSSRANAYYEYIYNGFLFTNPDSASKLAHELTFFGSKMDLPIGQANGLKIQGISAFFLSDHSTALGFFKRSLKIYEQLNDKYGIGSSLNSIGVLYATLENDSKALTYFSQSLEISEQQNIQKGKGNLLMNIGSIYGDQGDYAKALDYVSRGKELAEKTGDQLGLANSLANIGSIYVRQGDYPKALDYLIQCAEQYDKLDHQRGLAYVLANIGTIYQLQGDYPKALDYCQRGRELALSSEFLTAQKEACKCLYDTYKAMGKGNKALVFLEEMNVVDDSLNAEETNKKLQQMEFAKHVLADSLAQVETDRLVKEAHLEEVRKNNKTRNMLAGGGLLVLLLAGGLYSRNRYIKKSRDIISNERDRSENLLLNILPAEIAAELKANGKAEARDFDQISILFTDFKEFTQLSEQLSAKELVAEINHCFEAFDAICGKYKVEKIKTIGDSFMAAGGLPVPNAESTKNTVLAAIEMAEFVSDRKKEREAAGQIPFEMRAGIHTGNVVAGIVGVKKFQYDIWGDTVNTASRMESHGEVGKVNISQSTYELIKEDPQFTFEHRGKVEAKGKGEVDMYFVSLA